MNLVLQLMTGVSLAGLAEGMALADRSGLQQKDVLEVLGLTTLACPLLLEKGRGERGGTGAGEGEGGGCLREAGGSERLSNVRCCVVCGVIVFVVYIFKHL